MWFTHAGLSMMKVDSVLVATGRVESRFWVYVTGPGAHCGWPYWRHARFLYMGCSTGHWNN